jgi:hypothetical protein
VSAYLALLLASWNLKANDTRPRNKCKESLVPVFFHPGFTPHVFFTRSTPIAAAKDLQSSSRSLNSARMCENQTIRAPSARVNLGGVNLVAMGRLLTLNKAISDS